MIGLASMRECAMPGATRGAVHVNVRVHKLHSSLLPTSVYCLVDRALQPWCDPGLTSRCCMSTGMPLMTWKLRLNGLPHMLTALVLEDCRAVSSHGCTRVANCIHCAPVLL
jgi:hypothetical protein